MIIVLSENLFLKLKEFIIEALPFFVYGTLRAGEPNHDYFLRNKYSRVILGYAQNFELRGRIEMFPFALPKENSRTVGELFWIEERFYKEVLRSLDSLEGFNENNPESSFYKRIIVEIESEAGESFKAWMYIANEDDFENLRTKHSVIPENDWLKRYPELPPL